MFGIVRMAQKKATSSNWALVNPVLAEGELGVEEDTRIVKFGDGITPWRSLLGIASVILSSVSDSVKNAIKMTESGQVQVHDGTSWRLLMSPVESLGSAFTYQAPGVPAGGTTLMTTIGGVATQYAVPRRGRLVIISALSSAAIAAGNMNLRVLKNGAPTDLFTVLSAANQKNTADLTYANGIPVDVNDTLSVQITGSGDLNPVTAAFNAMIYFVPDPILS